MSPTRRSRRSGRSSSRKTYWAGSQWVGNEVTFADDASSASFWARWPSNFNDPHTVANSVTPSDETLVRTILNMQMLTNDDIISFVTAPKIMTFGLIAFDGGQSPDFYDAVSFAQGASVGPPLPASQPGEDWIIRLPMIFQQANSFQGPVATQFIESKAMRKLPPGTGLLGVLEYSDVLGVLGETNWSFGFDIRMAFRSGYTT